jgi:hypothetical protein
LKVHDLVKCDWLLFTEQKWIESKKKNSGL